MDFRHIFCSLFMMICFFGEAQAQTPADSANSDDTASNGTSVFEKVEIEASFTGGEMAWRKFLEKNLNANVPVDNGAPAGRFLVIVQFVVNKEGSISDVKALTKHGFGMEQEVMRIIKIGPKWAPAIQRGRNVNAYRKQPVTFMVQDESFDIHSQEPFVLYVGIENPITISADRVKSEDLQVSISQGSIISKGNGNYVVKVTKPGSVVIELTNARKGKKIGAASFEVRTLSKP